MKCLSFPSITWLVGALIVSSCCTLSIPVHAEPDIPALDADKEITLSDPTPDRTPVKLAALEKLDDPTHSKECEKKKAKENHNLQRFYLKLLAVMGTQQRQH